MGVYPLSLLSLILVLTSGCFGLPVTIQQNDQQFAPSFPDAYGIVAEDGNGEVIIATIKINLQTGTQVSIFIWKIVSLQSWMIDVD